MSQASDHVVSVVTYVKYVVHGCRLMFRVSHLDRFEPFGGGRMAMRKVEY